MRNSGRIRATFLIEGEEEAGSPSLVPCLKANAKELSCDAAFVCDTNMWDARTPAITSRLRGMVHDEITITGSMAILRSFAPAVELIGSGVVDPRPLLSEPLPLEGYGEALQRVRAGKGIKWHIRP